MALEEHIFRFMMSKENSLYFRSQTLTRKKAGCPERCRSPCQCVPSEERGRKEAAHTCCHCQPWQPQLRSRRAPLRPHEGGVRSSPASGTPPTPLTHNLHKMRTLFKTHHLNFNFWYKRRKRQQPSWDNSIRGLGVSFLQREKSRD